MKLRTMSNKFVILIVISIFLNVSGNEKPGKKAQRIGKDVRDMTDHELEMLLDQWEEDEEPLEDDELPEHLRPQPKIDLSKMDLTNPDNVLKMTKKGRSLMMFVDVNPELSQDEANNVLSIWQTSLQNNHIVAERYPLEDKRAIFMFRDGAQAVDAKNFFLEQPECAHVTLEGQNYVGKYASEAAKQKVEHIQVRTKPEATVEKVKKSEL